MKHFRIEFSVSEKKSRIHQRSVLLYLDFTQNRDYRGHDAQEQVKADEELVDEALIRFGVEDKEKPDSSQRQGVVQHGDGEQS